MKWITSIVITASIFFGLIFLPIFIAFLMSEGVVQFMSGQVDTWILFWGSYAGVIIGSVAVYVVAKVQIKKQSQQQLNEIKSESRILYQRDINDFRLRNKITKIDEMISMSDKFHIIIIDIRTDLYNALELFRLGEVELINSSEEANEENLNTFFENITKLNKECNLQFRKIWTLSSYFMETQIDLREIESLLHDLDRDIGTVFNVHNSYECFMSDLSSEPVRFEIQSIESIIIKVPEFIVHNLKKELTKNLDDVKLLADVRIKLTNIPSHE